MANVTLTYIVFLLSVEWLELIVLINLREHSLVFKDFE